MPNGDGAATPYVGQHIDDAALGLMRWNGTNWVRRGARTQYTQTTATAIAAATYTKIGNFGVDVNDIGLTSSAAILTFPPGSAPFQFV